jgi:hypothetical protein
MSAEHLRGSESTPEISSAELEHKLEQLSNKTERESTESTQARQAEAAREAITQVEPASRRNEKETTAPAHHPTRLDKQAAYDDTMRSMRRRLKPASRAFSKVIHAPIVEKTSEVAAKTVFRPSVTLGATFTALILTASLYATARYYGFAISGSEFIFSLILGGIAGFVLELIGRMFKHK